MTIMFGFLHHPFRLQLVLTLFLHFASNVNIIQLLTYDEGNIWYVGPEDKMLPEAEGRGQHLSEGPTYHMLPESPVNNCFVIPSLV